MYVRDDHSSITSSKRWVGGVRKWQFLTIYSTVNYQRGGWVGLKKSKTWWHNTWTAPYPIIRFWKQIKTWPFVTVGFWLYLYDIRKKSISFSFISHHHGSSEPRRTYGRFRILYRNSALRLLLLLSFTNTWAFLILASTLDRSILERQWDL